MEASQPDHSLFCSFAKPLVYSQHNGTIAIAHDDQQIMLLDPQLKANSLLVNSLTDKPWSIRIKENLLVRGGSEGSINLWDVRELYKAKPIHTFNKQGHKINAVDWSQHILAAGTSKGATFWDMRKMKQRCEFTESFNEEVTGLQFSIDEPTIFHTCSMDGLIARFDLREPNEQDAFSWGHQIIESPSKLQLRGQTTLIETQNQVVLTLEQQSLKQRFAVNMVQNPTHILNSQLGADKSIRYYTKTMKTNAVEYWIGNYNVGYLPTKVDIQMLIPIKDQTVIFSDQKGNWHHSSVVAGVSSRNIIENENFMTVEELEAKTGKKIVTTQKVINQNGFILSKPSTLKNHNKKFKPY